MEAALVLVIAGATILVLATERLSPEVTGLLVMVALVLTGVLDATSAFAGLASPAILMIAGVMLMTGALVHNGVPQRLVRAVRGLSGRSERRAGVLLIAAVNALSAFINNVAATAMFVPVAEGLASTFGSDRRRWLMPVAFASMTGGTCTLIGTSTNVAVSGALPALGLSPLSFFELTPLGLVVAAVGLLYLVTVGQRTIAAAPTPEAPRDEVREFLFEVRLGREAPVVGRDVEAADLQDRYGLTLLAIVRGDRQLDEPAPSEILRGGDLLLVKSRLERITELSVLPGFRVVSMPMQQREALFGDPPRFAEATVSHDSPLVGRTLEEADFRHHFGVTVLAVYRRHELIARKVGKIRLHAGDVLLLYGRPDLVEGLGDGEARLLVAGVVGAPAGAPRALASAAVFLGAIVAAVTGWLDAPTAFLGGGALVVALGCLPARLAGGYAHVRFLVMLAGLISLGVAMEESGAAALGADAAVRIAGGEPLALLALLFVLTVLLTQALGNAAAALLVLPLAVGAAAPLALDPRPLAVTVTVAASCSFLTPFEPACLLVYATGRYRFSDFARMGLPLTLLVLLCCLLLVPRLWPL